MIFTASRVNAINELREELNGIENELFDAGREASKEGNGYRSTPIDYGRAMEAVDAAEEALFNALNVVASYIGEEKEPIADKWANLKAWRDNR